MSGYTFRPTPNCTLPDPSQQVLFGRPFAKFWSLNPVETDTFFSLNKFVTMHNIGPRILDGLFFILGSQYRFEIFEGSDEQYFLRGVG